MLSRFSPHHRDAADRPAASHRPEMADLVDRLEDELMELVCEQGVEMSPGMARVVGAIASGMGQGGPKAERLQKAFGFGPVMTSDLQELAQKLMERIDGDSRPRLEAACVDFAFGLGLNGGKSQTEIASEHGVGRACVSKRCVNLAVEFERYPADGSAPARGMRSGVARGVYAERQKGKRLRARGETWGFKGLLTGIFGKELAHGS